MQNRSVQNSKEDCPTLLCKSFDDQYKRVQSFRNQYLNMIRIILKMQSNNKFPHLCQMEWAFAVTIHIADIVKLIKVDYFSHLSCS